VNPAVEGVQKRSASMTEHTAFDELDFNESTDLEQDQQRELPPRKKMKRRSVGSEPSAGPEKHIRSGSAKKEVCFSFTIL
jgi:hypothetical protein